MDLDRKLRKPAYSFVDQNWKVLLLQKPKPTYVGTGKMQICRFADLQIGVGNMQILNADWSEFYPLAKSASHRVKCRLDCLIIWYVG